MSKNLILQRFCENDMNYDLSLSDSFMFIVSQIPCNDAYFSTSSAIIHTHSSVEEIQEIIEKNDSRFEVIVNEQK